MPEGFISNKFLLSHKNFGAPVFVDDSCQLNETWLVVIYIYIPSPCNISKIVFFCMIYVVLPVCTYIPIFIPLGLNRIQTLRQYVKFYLCTSTRHLCMPSTLCAGVFRRILTSSWSCLTCCHAFKVLGYYGNGRIRSHWGRHPLARTDNLNI